MEGTTAGPRRTWWRGVLLVGAWAAVGVVSAVQLSLSTAAAGAPIDFRILLHRQVLYALPWAGATVLAVRLARRWPLRRDDRLRPITLHLAMGIATVVGLNLVMALLQATIGPPDWRPADPLGTAWIDLMSWGHMALIVYLALVGGAMVLRPPDAPDGVSGSPGQGTPEHDADAAGDPARSPASAPGPSNVDLDAALVARDRRGAHRIPVDAIRWIRADGDYVRVAWSGGEHLVAERMRSLARRLAPHGFARVHRSAIVRLAAVRSWHPRTHGDYTLVLDDGEELPLSRGRRADVLALLEEAEPG